MAINEILDAMEDIIERSLSLPLSNGRCFVDGGKLTDFINEIRLNLPSEIKHSKMIVMDRAQIISDAKKEAESIISNAEQRAKRLVNEQDIVKRAQEQANQMLSDAYTQSKELRRTSNEFIDEMLKNAEETFAKALAETRETRQSFKKMSSAKLNPSRKKL